MLAILLAALLPWLANRWRRYRGEPGVGPSWWRFLVPVSVIVAAGGLHELVEGPLNLTGNVLEVVLHGTEAVMFLGGAWAVGSFSGVVAEIIIASPRISEKGLDANLLRFGFRLLGLVIAVLIIVTGLAEVGVPGPRGGRRARRTHGGGPGCRWLGGCAGRSADFGEPHCEPRALFR
jgi:hypothetical protein